MGHEIECQIQPRHMDAAPPMFLGVHNKEQEQQELVTVFFKHQYITNPTVSPESHVVVAAQQLATALKGNIPAGNKMAEALKKVSNLFTKIAAAKNKVTNAKAQKTE